MAAIYDSKFIFKCLFSHIMVGVYLQYNEIWKLGCKYLEYFNGFQCYQRETTNQFQCLSWLWITEVLKFFFFFANKILQNIKFHLFIIRKKILKRQQTSTQVFFLFLFLFFLLSVTGTWALSLFLPGLRFKIFIYSPWLWKVLKCKSSVVLAESLLNCLNRTLLAVESILECDCFRESPSFTKLYNIDQPYLYGFWSG